MTIDISQSCYSSDNNTFYPIFSASTSPPLSDNNNNKNKLLVSSLFGSRQSIWNLHDQSRSWGDWTTAPKRTLLSTNKDSQMDSVFIVTETKTFSVEEHAFYLKRTFLDIADKKKKFHTSGPPTDYNITLTKSELWFYGPDSEFASKHPLLKNHQVQKPEDLLRFISYNDFPKAFTIDIDTKYNKKSKQKQRQPLSSVQKLKVYRRILEMHGEAHKEDFGAIDYNFKESSTWKNIPTSLRYQGMWTISLPSSRHYDNNDNRTGFSQKGELIRLMFTYKSVDAILASYKLCSQQQQTRVPVALIKFFLLPSTSQTGNPYSLYEFHRELHSSPASSAIGEA